MITLMVMLGTVYATVSLGVLAGQMAQNRSKGRKTNWGTTIGNCAFWPVMLGIMAGEAASENPALR